MSYVLRAIYKKSCYFLFIDLCHMMIIMMMKDNDAIYLYQRID